MKQLPNFDEIYTTIEGSIGQYVPGECAKCKLGGSYHIIDICRVCGWPPAGDGRCMCDVEHDRELGLID